MSGSGTRRTTILNRRAGQTARLGYWGRRYGPVLALALVLGGGGYYASSSGWLGQKEMGAARAVHGLLADRGFRVQNLMIEGRVYTSREGLKNLIGVKKGQSIFEPDLAELKTRLEEITWVKSAVVERHLPDTLYVRLTERKPLALWQKKNKLTVVDDEGVALTDRDLDRFRSLMIIVGDDAPKHARDLVAMIEAEPDLRSRVESAKWVGDRRWDLYLKNGVAVRLPEEDVGQAVRRLADAQKEGRVMDRKVAAIDLRDPVRIIVQTEPGAVQEYQAAFTPDKNI